MRQWLWTLGWTVALSACGDGSPTEPQPPPRSSSPTGAPYTLVFADGGELSDSEAAIRGLIEETFERVRLLLNVDGVTMTVTSNQARVIPGYGVGGFAPNGFSMEIAIDPAFPSLTDVLSDRVPVIVAHELHHNARWRGPGYGSTLLESMVSEGLADHFAVELLDAPLAPWSNAFPPSRDQELLDRARPLFDSTSFGFSAWFFGVGTDLPRWTGYTLGYRLVEDFQEQNPGRTAADLVNTPASAFRPE